MKKRIFTHVNHKELEQLFLLNFKHDGTSEQLEFFHKLARFIYSKPHTCFLLTGYAGTGKTTVVKSIVDTYTQLNGNIVLLAPTGRASKVLAQRTGKFSSTIHRHIYMPKNQGGHTTVSMRPNKFKHALFVVDEASMIADRSSDTNLFGNRSLLDDLVMYVESGHYCKLLFIGDTAQLPPVGLALSPALDPRGLDLTYNLNPVTHKLTQVIRQAEASNVLKNATHIRKLIDEETVEKPKITLNQDVVRLTDAYEMEEVFQNSFSDIAKENGIMIVRSNKRANQYNLDIRSRIQYKDDIINSSDKMMVVKNSYYWLPESSKISFIANGDTLEVLSIRNRENLYGHEFVDATVQLLDYPEEEAIDVKLLVDVLQVDGPSLNFTQQQALYSQIELEYAHIGNKKNRTHEVLNNPYYNALQIKFAHVVTCHKAQGGQWPNVIIEQSWLPDGEIDREYLRWLYTAITRAEERVYLIGFDDSFFA